jgi:hypothetical protein
MISYKRPETARTKYGWPTSTNHKLNLNSFLSKLQQQDGHRFLKKSHATLSCSNINDYVYTYNWLRGRTIVAILVSAQLSKCCSSFLQKQNTTPTWCDSFELPGSNWIVAIGTGTTRTPPALFPSLTRRVVLKSAYSSLPPAHSQVNPPTPPLPPPRTPTTMTLPLSHWSGGG